MRTWSWNLELHELQPSFRSQWLTTRTPISVYMRDTSSVDLINIAKYGEEYRNDEEIPINVLFHGRQQEAELRLIAEETAKRIEEAIRKRVEESLNSEEVQLEIQRRLEEGRKRLNDEVAAQLDKEKEAALIEARQKEEQARKEKEELEIILEENRRKIEEARRLEALEQQRREEERYRELEEMQRQKKEPCQKFLKINT